MKSTRFRSVALGLLLSFGLVGAACSSSSSSNNNPDAAIKKDSGSGSGGHASGGSSGSGGSGGSGSGGSASGGSSGSGGSGGSSSSGGSSGSGGSGSGGSGGGGATGSGANGGTANDGGSGGSVGSNDGGQAPDRGGDDAIDAPLTGPDGSVSMDTATSSMDGGSAVQLDTGALDTQAVDTMVVLLDAEIDTTPMDVAALDAPADAAGLDMAADMADAAASCVAQIVANGYAYTGVAACSACSENGNSVEQKCKDMIDCVSTNYPCSGNCHSTCLNSAQGDGVVDTCVTNLVTTACGGSWPTQ